MLKKLNGAALVLLASTVLSQAHANTRVTIEPNGFSLTDISVTSEDGKTWTKVENKQLLLNVTIGLGKTDEQVMGYKIRQEWLPQASTVPWLVTRNLNPYQATVDKNELVPGSTENLTPAERTMILKGCNAKLAAGGSINETHNFFYGVKMQIFGSFTSTNGPTGHVNTGSIGGKFGNGAANVRVTCKGVIGRPGGVVAEAPKDLKVGAIDLFRTTYTNATSQPNPGTVCKKAKWLVRLSTNKAGPVKFKLSIKNGDAPLTSKIVDAWSQFDGAGKFKAEYSEWTEVTKTSVVQAMAEDMTNPIGQSTGWKDITLHCTGAGGGGLADAPHNANPDNGTMPNTLKVTGELTLADKAGAPKDKPRLGQAVFKIWASKPGNTAYKLTCSGGRNWEGTLPTFKIADHKYQAVGAQNFQIDKTEQIGCVLRSMSMPKDDVIALDSKLFELIKRNPDLGGPGNVVNLPKPQDGGAQHPARPGIKIAPTPKISCAGGTVRNNACFCPPGTTKVHAGTNAYRCMTRLVKPQRLAPPAARRPVPHQTQRLRHRLQSADAGNR